MCAPGLRVLIKQELVPFGEGFRTPALTPRGDETPEQEAATGPDIEVWCVDSELQSLALDGRKPLVAILFAPGVLAECEGFSSAAAAQGFSGGL